MTERMEEKKTNFATEEEMEKLSVSFRDVLSNQAFFLQILDDLPFGCYIMHPDQKVIYWNQEAERLIGYTPGKTATISTTVYQLWRTNDEAGAFFWVMINLGISTIVLLTVNLLESRQKAAVKK